MNTTFVIISCILIASLSVFGQFANAQAPAIEWQKALGGTNEDFTTTILQLDDGGYINCGSTSSSDGDFTTNQGGYDAYVVKLDNSGAVVWQKTYGGSGDELFHSIIQTSNGGFIALGNTSSNDGDVSGNHGGDNDTWVVRLSPEGNLQGQHCYGGSGDDQCFRIVRANGNNYVFAGTSNSNDGDVRGNHGDYDAWVVKINHSGHIIWSKTFGGSDYDELTARVTTHSKLVFLGNVFSNDGDVSGNHGGLDGWMVKLNQGGNLIQAKCLGGTGDDYGNAITLTTDGNVAMAFGTNSNDGDVSGNHGGFDMWVPKINVADGNIIWQECFGSSQDEAAFGIMSTNEGSLVALGATAPDANDPTGYDAQAVKIDADGNEVWTKTFGGSDGEDVGGAIETGDAGLLFSGSTSSYDGDVSGQHGMGDGWLVKLAANGERMSAPGAITSRRESNSNSRLYSQNPNNRFAGMRAHGLFGRRIGALVSRLEQETHVVNSDPEKMSSSIKSTSGFGLKNHPNPFNPTTRISFEIPADMNVTLTLYDVLGREVAVLLDGFVSSGYHQVTLDGRSLAGGTYIYTLTAGLFTESKRLLLLK